MEVTFELSCCKHPRAKELHKEWDLNRESLLAYMEKVSRPSKTKETDNSCASIPVSLESWKLQLMVTLSPLQNATHLLFYVFRTVVCPSQCFSPFTILRVLTQCAALSGPHGRPWLREGGRRRRCSGQRQHCGVGHPPQPDHRGPWGVLPAAAARDVQHHSCGSGVNMFKNRLLVT